MVSANLAFLERMKIRSCSEMIAMIIPELTFACSTQSHHLVLSIFVKENRLTKTLNSVDICKGESPVVHNTLNSDIHVHVC